MDLMGLDNASKTPEARRWTNEELHKLFKDYFDKLPGICPVCQREVGMMMDHKDSVTILTIRCRNCGNSSTVMS
jgi:transcription elongation factor Elf1